eukprot:scaffold34853_cov31-Tisochrysis_lutea.AAC.1
MVLATGVTCTTDSLRCQSPESGGRASSGTQATAVSWTASETTLVTLSAQATSDGQLCIVSLPTRIVR